MNTVDVLVGASLVVVLSAYVMIEASMVAHYVAHWVTHYGQLCRSVDVSGE